MQTSPLIFENTSFVFSNPATTTEEEQSYDTTIPFLDDTQRNSLATRSGETSSRQRTRNWSRVSERPIPDNESTLTVNFQLILAKEE